LHTRDKYLTLRLEGQTIKNVNVLKISPPFGWKNPMDDDPIPCGIGSTTYFEKANGLNSMNT
jgi:hypothetical protein